MRHTNGTTVPGAASILVTNLLTPSVGDGVELIAELDFLSLVEARGALGIVGTSRGR
jgi:hypothetical protein